MAPRAVAVLLAAQAAAFAVASAGRVDVAPADFAARAHGVLAHVGSSPAELAAALEAAAELVRETAAACRPPR